MVKLYVKYILNGMKTIEDVPKLWRKQVEEELEKLKKVEG